MNNNVLNKLLPISICLFLFGIFNIITPHNGEYGDQASENMLFLETFDEYYSGNHNESYQEFIQEKNRYIFSEYIDSNTFIKHGIELPAPTSLRWVPEVVKALPRMLHYSIYRILGRTVEMNQVFAFVSYLIFFLTFIYAYRFGKVILGDKFAIILSGVFVSNFYFNQLLHGSLEPQLNVFPFLLLMGLYGISNTLSEKSFKLIKGSLFLGGVLGLGFLNGYPNTQLILPIFLIGYLYIFNINHPNKMLIEKTSFLLLSVIFGVLIYSILAILYSISIGEPPLFHHDIFFVRLVTVFSGAAFSGTLDGSFLTIISETFGKIWVLLSTGYRYVHAPHQPGILINLPFLNFLELLMLFIGIISTVFIKNMSIVRYFSIYLLFFFIIRAFSNNNTLVDKSSFDYFVLLLFLVALGMYYFVAFMLPQLFNKIMFISGYISRKIIYIIFNINIKLPIFKESILGLRPFKWMLGLRPFKWMPLFYSVILTLTSSGINSNTFNNTYLFENDANLAEWNGFSKVREFIKENASDSTLIIYGYSHGLNNSIYRMDFMRDKRNFLLMSDLKSVFPTPEDMTAAVTEGKYSNIIIIDRAAAYRWGKRIENLGYHYKRPDSNRYYSFMNPSIELSAYSGIPTYWIYNIDKNNLHTLVDIPNYSSNGAPQNITFSFDLDGRNLKGLDIPGNLSKVNLLCNGSEILSLDNNERQYDYIHVNTDGSYKAAKYTNWNYGFDGGLNTVLVNGQIIMDESLGLKLRTTVNRFFVNEEDKGAADILMNLKLNLPIDRVLMSTPYFLYNDYKRKNAISISLSGIDSSGVENEYYNQQIISDGSGLFGTHTYMNGDEEYQVYDLSTIKLSGEDEINLQYEIIGRNSSGAMRSTIYSNFHGLERSLNYIVMYGKKPDLLGNCQGLLTFNATSESFKKISDLETYIGLTYSTN